MDIPLQSLPPPPSPLTSPGNLPRASLDDTVDLYIAKLNWAQIFQLTLVSVSFCFEIQQNFVTTFTDAVPKWSCSNSDCKNKTSNLCELPAGSWSWDAPKKTSIISEWSLQCSNPIIRSLSSSAFFVGSLIGELLLAILSDSIIGRKNTVVFCCLIMSVSGILTAFSRNIWMYSGFRFITGLGKASVGSTGMVLAAEGVGKKFRSRAAMSAYFWGSFGFVSLPVFGYWCRDQTWRWVHLWVSSPCLIYFFLVWFFVSESPRWLFLRRRKDECVNTLKRYTVPENWIGLEQTLISRWEENEDESKDAHVFSTLSILVKKSWSLRRLTAVMLAGFTLGLVNYGTRLGLRSISFNLYLSTALNGLYKIPAALLSFIFIGKVQRRILILSLALICAISSLVSAIVKWKSVQISFELLSFFTAVTAFEVYLIYVLELFPTCVRSSAVLLFRVGVTLGGAIGPLAVAAGKENRIVSYGIYSAAIALCGSTVGFLPETKGRIWLDTMEEEEHRDLSDGGAHFVYDANEENG